MLDVSDASRVEHTNSSIDTKKCFENPPFPNVSTVVQSKICHRDSCLSEDLDFSDLHLVCPINVDEITVRWMHPYIPHPEQTVKNYPAGVMVFVTRILKSYTNVAIRGADNLPFVHLTEMKQGTTIWPLTTCLSVARMFQNPLPNSEYVVAEIIQHEMDKILDLTGEANDLTLLSGFQSYLLYSLLLFFHLEKVQPRNPRQVMIDLQTIACTCCRKGLVCATDEVRLRPRWEEWILVEAKRRTLYVMYLFDSIVSAKENLPTYLGTELKGIPAPASKTLWISKSRSDWENAYNSHLAEWTEHGLTIDELWPIPAEFSAESIEKRQRRIDQWVQGVDEYGTMLYAVVSCTHEV